MLQQDTAHQRAEGPRRRKPTAAHSPSAILRWLASAKVLRIPASVAGTIIAAPTASKAREAISVMAVGDSAAHSEAMPKWRCRAAAGA